MLENNCLKKILIDFCIIFLFLCISFLIIGSKYNFVTGDAGTYAFKTKLLYEKHEIDLKEQSAMSIGQLLFGYIFSVILGFSLKTLHISAYFAVFICMICFYLLLLQIGAERYLALIGAICLFINPITLQFIDWYMTEAYFLVYFFIAINLFVAGLKSGRAIYFYLGAIFSTMAIFTRQFAICLSIALMVLLFIERKQLKSNFIHILLSALIPILSLALFYLTSPSVGDAKQLYSARILFMKRLLNPVYFILILLRDTLYSLHYCTLYALPLVLILLVGAFIKKDYFNRLLKGKRSAFIISFAFMGLGTVIIFFKYKKLMPYLPSIFGIGAVTNLFGMKILENHTASFLLTILTAFGGMLILAKIVEHLDWNKSKHLLLGKHMSNNVSVTHLFIYLIGIFYFLLNTVSCLIYDRYIFPVAIFVIFFILIKCKWIMDLKKTAFIILLIIYSIFIFNLKQRAVREELLWDACENLMEKGVKPLEINAGCGFGFYYNFYPIMQMYKNVAIKQALNWHKFHPLANYFVMFSLKWKDHPGLELIDTLQTKSRLPQLKYSVYTFKRKAQFKDPIWVR